MLPLQEFHFLFKRIQLLFDSRSMYTLILLSLPQFINLLQQRPSLLSFVLSDILTHIELVLRNDLIIQDSVEDILVKECIIQ